MSLHLFGNLVTPFGTAANNHAEAEGNLATLQKLIWMGETHTTVSAEAIRFALRRRLETAEASGANRVWDEKNRVNHWKDDEFKGWASEKAKTFIDDDLLGFMRAVAAKEEGTGGSANVRRAALEITRAVSLTPWSGDVIFNCATPGAASSAQKGKTSNPTLYGTEVHATRYQFGFALTPDRLRDRSRAAKAVEFLCNLGPVAGNHARFLFDFAPEAVVFRVTHEPAPKLLYCFESNDHGKTVVAPSLCRRIAAGDLDPKELWVGVSDLEGELATQLKSMKVSVLGVTAACKTVIAKLDS